MNNAEERKRGIRELLKPSATVLGAQPLGVSHRTPQTHRGNELFLHCPTITLHPLKLHPAVFLCLRRSPSVLLLLLLLQPWLISLRFSFSPPTFHPLDPRSVLWYRHSDLPTLWFHVAWDSLPWSNFLKNVELNYFCVAGRNCESSLAGTVWNDKSS